MVMENSRVDFVGVAGPEVESPVSLLIQVDGEERRLRLTPHEANQAFAQLRFALSGHRETWDIGINNGRYYFQRYIGPDVNEVYRPASQPEAVVWAAAIMSGLQPPGCLPGLDKPAPETQAESHARSEVSGD